MKRTEVPHAGGSPSAEEIKERRADARMTQQEAADACHCTRRLWQMYEAGQIIMPPERWELFFIKTRARVGYTERSKRLKAKHVDFS